MYPNTTLRYDYDQTHTIRTFVLSNSISLKQHYVTKNDFAISFSQKTYYVSLLT
jgi:hypothetical protein